MTIAYLTGAFIICLILLLNRNRFINYLNVILFSVLQWAFTVYQYTHRGLDFSGYFNTDALAVLMLFTVSIITIPAFFHSYIYFKTNRDHPRERGIYFSSTVVLITSVSAAYLANHIALMWVFVEMTTLAATALIYHRRNTRSLEGAWKYIFVSSISITIVFIGILFLGIALQQEGYNDLSNQALIQNAGKLNEFWLKLAFLFIFTGFTVKMGLVPMHTAGIDAKDKAPSPAGALFSSALLNMGFVGIFRFYQIIAHTHIQPWANNILFISALLSVFVAAVYMLSVKNLKRMFAYSSIEHMGIVILGIAAGGIGYYAAILHLILHSFIKSSMFFQMGQIYRIYQSKSLYDTGNYFRYNLPGAMVMLLAFVCAAAMPPSGLFVSEFMIFRALFEGHNIFILILIMLLLTIILWSFGKNIFRLLFTPPVGSGKGSVEKIYPLESVSQFILLGLVIYLGINPPSSMIGMINEVVKNLLY